MTSASSTWRLSFYPLSSCGEMSRSPTGLGRDGTSAGTRPGGPSCGGGRQYDGYGRLSWIDIMRLVRAWNSPPARCRRSLERQGEWPTASGSLPHSRSRGESSGRTTSAFGQSPSSSGRARSRPAHTEEGPGSSLTSGYQCFAVWGGHGDPSIISTVDSPTGLRAVPGPSRANTEVR